MAVLPFLPSGADDPKEGWAVAVKLLSKINSGVSVQAVNWAELKSLMEKNGFDKSRLRDPAVLREIGRKLSVDSVLTGEFSARGGDNVARARLVRIGTGRVSQSPEYKVARDVVVKPPEFTVEPPVLDEEDPLAMRDSVADDTCENARGRVDHLEENIMDLKTRYWAIQLGRGVGMTAVTFNPGSTISDPDLKRKFYKRLHEWESEDAVPELSPAEMKRFEEADQEAFALARRCRIL